MRRLDGRAHFRQHFDEAINGIRRLAPGERKPRIA
jgi:hypothetical protein